MPIDYSKFKEVTITNKVPPTQPTNTPSPTALSEGKGVVGKGNDIFLGPNLDMMSKSGIDTKITAEEMARAAAKSAAELSENTAIQGVIDSYVAKGVPITEITAPMLFVDEGIKKLGLTNIGKIKDLLETSKKDKQQIASETLKSQIELLMYRANSIPTKGGPIGKFGQGAINYATSASGLLPEKESFDSVVQQSLGTMARSLGEVGNLNEQEQIRMEKGLKDLGSPQSEIRKLAKENLLFLFNEKGLNVKIDPFYKIKQKMEKIIQEENLANQPAEGVKNTQPTKQLTPEQEKRAAELLKML